MQACYELKTSCFSISGSIVYCSDGAMSWTAGIMFRFPTWARDIPWPKISDISWGPPSLVFSQSAPEDLCCG